MIDICSLSTLNSGLGMIDMCMLSTGRIGLYSGVSNNDLTILAYPVPAEGARAGRVSEEAKVG